MNNKNSNKKKNKNNKNMNKNSVNKINKNNKNKNWDFFLLSMFLFLFCSWFCYSCSYFSRCCCSYKNKVGGTGTTITRSIKITRQSSCLYFFSFYYTCSCFTYSCSFYCCLLVVLDILVVLVRTWQDWENRNNINKNKKLFFHKKNNKITCSCLYSCRSRKNKIEDKDNKNNE